MDRIQASDAGALEACISALNLGQVVVVPTARWYMFAARADVATTAPTIFQLKRRPPDKSLLLIAPSYEWAVSNFVLPPPARLLADAFWPGDLSMRLRWQEPSTGYSAVGVPVGLVAVAPGWLGKLAAVMGIPLISTSVNFSGTPAKGGTQPSFAYGQVQAMLEKHPDAASIGIAIDGGVCPLVEASAVVDCSGPNAPVLERAGAVHVDALRFVTPDLDISCVRRDMTGFLDPRQG